jgi:hypothetical protein
VESVEGSVIHAKLRTDVQKNPGVNAHYKMFGEGDTIAVYNQNTVLEKQRWTVEKVQVTGDFTADIFVSDKESELCGLSLGDTIENLSIQAELHIKNCRFGKASTHLRLQTRGKILIEDSECSLTLLMSGDKNYWYEASPVTDITIRNCRLTGPKGCAYLVSCAEYAPISEAPYYHSGVKVINNVFENANALALSNIDGVLFEGNTTMSGEPFNNVIFNCNNVVEK